MGYGLLAASPGRVSYVTCGALRARASAPIEQRLRQIHAGLLDLLREHRPDEVAVEEPYLPRLTAADESHQSSARAAIAVGQAQAVVLLAAAECSIPVFRYSPAQVKRAVSEYGRGSKEQVQEMVRLLLGLDVKPEPADAADALAVAICHAQQQLVERLLAAGGS